MRSRVRTFHGGCPSEYYHSRLCRFYLYRNAGPLALPPSIGRASCTVALQFPQTASPRTVGRWTTPVVTLRVLRMNTVLRLASSLSVTEKRPSRDAVSDDYRSHDRLELCPKESKQSLDLRRGPGTRRSRLVSSRAERVNRVTTFHSSPRVQTAGCIRGPGRYQKSKLNPKPKTPSPRPPTRQSRP